MNKWYQVLQAEAGDDGDQGGGGGEDQTASKLAALQQSVDKLKQKNEELLGENSKYKNSLKDWEGLKPDQIKSMLKAFENDEEMKLISEGKHDEVIRKRTERVSAEYQSKLESEINEKNTIAAQLEAANSQVQKLLIDTNAVTAFIKAGGVDTAVDDVAERAKKIFKVENGEPIPRDKDGNIMRGKAGVLTMQEWAENLRETAPHLFPPSQGSNSNGNRQTGAATGIDAKIEAARKAGDVSLVRQLKEKKKKMMAGEE